MENTFKLVQGGEETVPEWRKPFPRGWRPIKMHTNEYPVPQTIGKMQVLGSKLCERDERVCNLSKRQRMRGGPAPAHEALAEIATTLRSFAQFAAKHLHFTDGLWDRVPVFMRFYGPPPCREQFPQLGSSLLTPPVCHIFPRRLEADS